MMAKAAILKIEIDSAVDFDNAGEAEKFEKQYDEFVDRVRMAVNSFKYPGWTVELIP